MPEFWLVAFDSTHHALSAEAALEAEDIEIDIRPTPKSITAGCALSIDFLPADYERVKQVLTDRLIVTRGYYRPEGEMYAQLS